MKNRRILHKEKITVFIWSLCQKKLFYKEVMLIRIIVMKTVLKRKLDLKINITVFH